MERIVIKIGTHVITGEDGYLDEEVMQGLVDQVAALKGQGLEVVLVSSGAVAAGRSVLMGHVERAGPIQEKQLLAAVGQIRLMEIFGRLFREKACVCAQVLVTKEDFRDRRHYLCMRDCLSVLLHDKIIPIANENDVVAIDELMFTDNDELAGLIASMLNADALFILTCVDGLYDRHPEEEGAKLIEEVDPLEVDLEHYACRQRPQSDFGRGGMHTKCRVAKKLSQLGTTTHVVNGRRPDILLDLAKGKTGLGTTFLPGKRISSMKKWIAQAEGQQKGAVTINERAVDTLQRVDKASSLLPVGVTAVDGDFEKGDVIQIKGPGGSVIGYGIAQYGFEEAHDYIGQRNKKALVHYDYLYLIPSAKHGECS